MSWRILLVEDDPELRRTLQQALQTEGYEVLTAASLAEGLALLTHARRSTEHAGTVTGGEAFDLILLDLGLPDGEGAALLRAVRQRHALPVLVISARHDEGQKIHLLDAGADDYLVKPFSVGELLARMRVAWRHRGTQVRPAVTHYRRAGIHVDLARQQVSRDGLAVHLTPTEYRLLARLVRSAGQVVTHRQLLGDVWGADLVEHTHYLRLYMGQLRAKLEAEPADPQLLLTEPGVGYRLAESERDDEDPGDGPPFLMPS